MSKRTPRAGSGRPGKGSRKAYITRLSPELSSRVEARAELDDLSYSDLIANALAEYLGMPPVVLPAAQEAQLQMTA